MKRSSLVALALIGALGPLLVAGPAAAQSPGVTPTEVKIGNTNPYSGPASAYGTIGKALAAYFTKVNAEGGVNGRKIDFVTLDDGYSPPKTVEMVRRLVEQGRPRRGSQEAHRAGAVLRGDGPDDRLADRESEEQRRERLLQRDDPEVRGPGDQEGARHRLEAAPPAQQRLGLGGRRAEARGARGLEGSDHRPLSQGPDRSAVAERRGHEGLAGLHAEVLPGRQHQRRVQRVRVHGRAGVGPRAEAVRQGSLAREHHATGGQHQGPRAAAPPAGHQGQHEPDGLLPDRAGAAREVRRRALGALRRGLRRRQEVARHAGAGKGTTSARTS